MVFGRQRGVRAPWEGWNTMRKLTDRIIGTLLGVLIMSVKGFHR